MNTKNTFITDVIWAAIVSIIIFFGLWYILSLFGLTDVAEQAQIYLTVTGIISAVVSVSLFIVRLRYLLKTK